MAAGEGRGRERGITGSCGCLGGTGSGILFCGCQRGHFVFLQVYSCTGGRGLGTQRINARSNIAKKHHISALFTFPVISILGVAQMLAKCYVVQ